MPSSRGKTGNARIVEGADHLVLRGQARARDAVRHHLGIAQDRRAALQRRFGGFGEIRRQIDVLRQVGHAAGMDHAHDDALRRAGKARQVGFRADDRERAAIDLGALADVLAGMRSSQMLRKGAVQVGRSLCRQ